MSDKREIKVIVTGDSSGGRRAIREMGDAADHADSKFRKFGGTLATWGTRAGLAIGAAAGAIAVLGVSTASQMEQAEIAFTNMLGSGQKADKFLKDLGNFAAKTPFEFPELVSSSQMLLAMGFNAKDLIPTLTAVGDAVAGMGGSGEQVQLVVRALGQMQAKGKIAGEELLQMTEQGIPALKILADGYGVSTGEMSKMVAAGKVLSDKAIPILVKGLENGTKNVKGFGGMMEQQSKTVQGRFSTMKDTIQMGLGNLAQKAFPLLNGAMQVATEGFDAFFKAIESGKGTGDGFTGFASNAGAAIKKFADWIRTDGIVWAQRLWGVIQDGISLFQSIVGWVTQNIDKLKILAAIFGTLIVVGKLHAAVMAIQAGWFATHILKLAVYMSQLSIIRGATALWTAAQWLLNIALNANPIGLIVLAIAALVAIFVVVYKNSETFRKAVEKLRDQFTEGIRQMGDAFSWFWDKVIRPVIRFIVNAFLNFVGTFIDGAALAFGWIPGVGDKLRGLQKGFREFQGKVNQALAGINDKTVNINAKYGSDFKAVVKAGLAASSTSAKARAIVLGYKRGGPVFGGGNGYSDSVDAKLSHGEHVWTAREVEAAGGHSAVESMRRSVLGFRAGGAVDFNLIGKFIGTQVARAEARTSNAMITKGVQAATDKALASLRTFGASGPLGSAVGVRPSFPWGRYPSGGFHPAYDYAVSIGTLVRSIIAGNVIRAGWDTGGFGWHVRTKDADRNYTIYGHLSRLLVRVGQFVQKGMGIGLSGNSGNSTGPHLHVERRRSPYSKATAFKFDEGGDLPPGMSMVWNGTGRPERIISPSGAGMGGVYVYVDVQGSVITERNLVDSITVKIRDSMLRHANRNGGRTGLPGK